MNEAVYALYIQLNTDIYNKMAELFGVSGSESVMAYHNTWLLMRDYPGSFVGAGLLVQADVYDSSNVLKFSSGQLLDTAEKIEIYADLMIEKSIEFAIFRLNKIQTFNADKAALGG